MVPLLGEAGAGTAGAAGAAAGVTADDLRREMSPAGPEGAPRISGEDFQRDHCYSPATGSPAPDDVLVAQVILDACRAGELDILETWQRRHRALGLSPRLQDLRDHQVRKWAGQTAAKIKPSIGKISNLFSGPFTRT